MKSIAFAAKTAALASVCVLSLAVGAQSVTDTGKTMTGNSTDATTEMADGEVRKIDKDNGKITLKHGAIKSLDMPGMTMVFRVGDKVLLDQVKVGDKLKFKAVSEGGKMVVTEIRLAE